MSEPKIPLSQVYNEDYMLGMARYPDKFFDLAIIDPPYGVLNLDWDKKIDVNNFLKIIYGKLADNGSIIFFSQHPLTAELVMALGKKFSHEIIWHKTQKLGFVNAKRMPLRAHENIIVAKNMSAVFYAPQMVKRGGGGRVRKQTKNRYQGYSELNNGGSYTDTGLKYPESVIKISNWNGALFGNTNNSTNHPTQKPVDIYKWLFSHYCRPECKIIDPFMGSQSSRIAAHNLGFDYHGFELNAKYFKDGNKRFKEGIAQLRLL